MFTLLFFLNQLLEQIIDISLSLNAVVLDILGLSAEI